MLSLLVISSSQCQTSWGPPRLEKNPPQKTLTLITKYLLNFDAETGINLTKVHYETLELGKENADWFYLTEELDLGADSLDQSKVLFQA